jgi:cytochrome c-type protein NapC
LWLELVNDYSTLEKFNERRLIMAHDARMNLKKWDSVTCRDCHKNPDPPGEDAQAAHKRMETHGATCIDCHQNLVHEEAPMTDLDASLAQKKLVLKADGWDDWDGAGDEDDEDDEDDDEDEDDDDD